MKNLVPVLLNFLLMTGLSAQNGAPDSSFNSNGKIDASYETANSICTDPNMKVLVLGHDNTTGNYNIFVNRYLANGSPDNSFGVNSRFLNDINNDRDYGRCIKSLSNGKYLVCGQNSVGPYFRAFILRLKSNGSLDSSFASNGILLISPNTANCDAWSMEVSESGSIYIAGYRTVSGVYKNVLWKIKPNGSIDVGFGTSGEKVISTNAYTERLYGIDLKNSSNSIAVAGVSSNGSNNEGIVALLDTNGNLKTTFNSTGVKKVVYSSYPTTLYDVSIQTNQVIVVGNYTNAVAHALVSSFALNGTINSAFANSGNFADIASYGSNYSQIRSDCVGSIYAAGYSSVNSKINFRVTKLNTNGYADSGFANNGHFTLRIKPNFDELIEAMDFYGNTGLVVSGRTNSGGGTTTSGIARIKLNACNNSGIVSQIALQKSVSIYPNPLLSGQMLKMKCELQSNEACAFRILSADGKEVYNGFCKSEDGIILPQGSSVLSPGVYQLLIIIAEKMYTASFLLD